MAVIQLYVRTIVNEESDYVRHHAKAAEGLSHRNVAMCTHCVHIVMDKMKISVYYESCIRMRTRTC
jgi:hypothetical protein